METSYQTFVITIAAVNATIISFYCLYSYLNVLNQVTDIQVIMAADMSENDYAFQVINQFINYNVVVYSFMLHYHYCY